MRYVLGNFGLHLFHFFIIVFSLIAWIPESLRLYHLALQVGILMSWLGYGIWHGDWGRCVITVIQWYWKERYRQRPSTESYIEYWIRGKFKWDIAPSKLERCTISIFAITSLISLALLSTQSN